MTVLALACLAGAIALPDRAPVAPDTLFSVQAGEEVVFETFEGVLVVRGDERVDGVRIEDARGGSFRATRERGRLTIRPEAGSRREVRVDLPRDLPVTVRARGRLDVDIRGVWGGVAVRMQAGELRLADVRGRVVADALNADVWATAIEGSLRIGTVEGEVMLDGVTGSTLGVETVSGAIGMTGISNRDVRVTTVDGDMRWEGPIQAGSEIRLTSHDGDVTVVLPEPGDIEAAVSTFDGTFESGYPVTVQRIGGGQPVRFRIGEPRATLTIEGFDSDIRILRRR